MKDHSIQIEMLLEKLSSIRQENAMLKFTLSELVDKSVMSDFLSRAEIMHNELIANDESLVLLIDSATQILSKLKGTSMRDSVPCLIKQQQLRDDFKTFEARFSNLKKQFHDEMLSKPV